MEKCAFKLLIYIFLVAIYSGDLFAQNSAITYKPVKDKDRHIWLGGHAGMTSSFGFSDKYVENKVGIMLTAFPVYFSRESFVSVGLAPSYILKARENVDVAVFLSGCASNITIANSGSYNFHSGVGLELDFKLANAAMWQLMVGYGMRDINDPNDLIASPTIGAGVYFNFFGE
jgi:hypothetical protein